MGCAFCELDFAQPIGGICPDCTAALEEAIGDAAELVNADSYGPGDFPDAEIGPVTDVVVNGRGELQVRFDLDRDLDRDGGAGE